MVKIQSSDFFAFTRIIKKMGVREEIKSLSKVLKGTEDRVTGEKALQVELIMMFIENIGNAEKEIYKFISTLTGKTLKELESLEVFMASLEEIFADETIQSFFKLALK